MSGVKQYILTNRISFVILYLLFTTFFSTTQIYALKTAPDTVAGDCHVVKPEKHDYFIFVNPGFYQSLQLFHDVICKKVRDGRIDLDKGNKMMNSIVTRCGICRGDTIFQVFKLGLKAMNMPESVIMAHEQYCKDTYDPDGPLKMKSKGLEERQDWLRNEIFCQLTKEIANPSSFLDILLEPDLECIRKFRERTDLICQNLRNNAITYSEARYRFNQAYLDFKNHLDAETVKKIVEHLKKTIDSLIDLLK